MGSDGGILGWAFWALVLALILGGHPWRFPAAGRYWIETLESERGLPVVRETPRAEKHRQEFSDRR